MSFRAIATRDAVLLTDSPTPMTIDIFRPCPAVTFLDLAPRGWHRAAAAYDGLVITHIVGHMKTREVSKRGWQEWETGTMMTGPDFERNLESTGGAGVLITFIASDLVEAVLECPIEAARIRTIPTPSRDLRTARLLVGALHDHLTADALNGPLFAESIAVALIAAASERPATLSAPTRLPDTALARLPDFIAANLHEALTLSRIAAEAGTSVRHLATAFRKTFGQSVHQYVLAQRVRRACRLLHMGVPGAETAPLCGFPESRSLARALRNVAGLTVRQARVGMPMRSDISSR